MKSILIFPKLNHFRRHLNGRGAYFYFAQVDWTTEKSMALLSYSKSISDKNRCEMAMVCYFQVDFIQIVKEHVNESCCRDPWRLVCASIRDLDCFGPSRSNAVLYSLSRPKHSVAAFTFSNGYSKVSNMKFAFHHHAYIGKPSHRNMLIANSHVNTFITSSFSLLKFPHSLISFH